MCWGRHTCSMGAIKALKSLAEIPPERRTPAVRATIGAGAEYLLRHHIFKRSHDLAKVSKPGWKRFGFPLMYQTDVLEILWILGRLGPACATSARAKRWASSPPRRTTKAAGSSGRPSTIASSSPSRPMASRAAGSRSARSRCSKRPAGWTAASPPAERRADRFSRSTTARELRTMPSLGVPVAYTVPDGPMATSSGRSSVFVPT